MQGATHPPEVGTYHDMVIVGADGRIRGYLQPNEKKLGVPHQTDYTFHTRRYSDIKTGVSAFVDMILLEAGGLRGYSY